MRTRRAAWSFVTGGFAAGSVSAIGVLVAVAAALLSRTSATAQTRADSWALDVAPYFYNLATVEGDSLSWLTMECTGDPPHYRRIHCVFTHLLVDGGDTPEQIATNAARTRNEMRRGSERELRAARTSIRTACGNRDAAAEMDARWCACAAEQQLASFRECFTTLAIERESTEAAACTAHVSRFEVDLERIHLNRWTGSLEGICGNVTSIVLDREPGHSALWTYAQTRVTGAAPTQEENPLCQGTDVGSRLVFSWRASRDSRPLPCSRIRM